MEPMDFLRLFFPALISSFMISLTMVWLREKKGFTVWQSFVMVTWPLFMLLLSLFFVASKFP